MTMMLKGPRSPLRGAKNNAHKMATEAERSHLTSEIILLSVNFAWKALLEGSSASAAGENGLRKARLLPEGNATLLDRFCVFSF